MKTTTTKAQADHLRDTIARLQAELEGLKRANSGLYIESNQYRHENDRLRAALQAVMREFVGDRTALNCQGGHIADQARQALSGGQGAESSNH